MTIRKTLLLAFLLVSLTPTVILTALAFATTRDTLATEVQNSLKAQASTAASEIDHMLFERLQNAVSWSRLDIMQDIRIRDIDKRLSQFLAEVRAAYGSNYQSIYCTDADGIIVAASDPGLIGRKPSASPVWLDATLTNGAVELDALRLEPESGHTVLPIHAVIESSFGGQPLGEIVLLFDWRQVSAVLDAAARKGQSAELLDEDDRPISTSTAPREDAVASPAAAVPPKAGGGTVGGPRVITGFDRSQGFEHFAGFGWTTMIVEPSATALRPVHRMAFFFLCLLLATLLTTSAVSILVARRIARPITGLTAFTRRFARDQALPEPPPHLRGEVGELTETFVATVRDLDRSRQDLVRASKLAVAGEIAATMAHEIRTPLGILRSSAQILQQEPGISAEGRELIGFIEGETERINRLLTSLLESGGTRPPRLERHDLRRIVHGSVAMLAAQAEQKRIGIVEVLGENPLWAECDDEQATQVVLNLLINALQILHAGDRIEISGAAEADAVRLEIGDSGPGIGEADRAKIFEPFVSMRSGGIGLGLAVVKHIVVAHHGEITVGESRLGGALFTIRLRNGAHA